MTQPSAHSHRPVLLHIVHDRGGGGQRWLTDFIAADTGSTNLVLRPFTHCHASSEGVTLYATASEDRPLGIWRFTQPIMATMVTHTEYKKILLNIINAYNVNAIIVSSLIGHSLDALMTQRPTLVVNHDYYPYCPAINLYFGDICTQCNETRVATCAFDNHHFNAFPNFTVEQRLAVRESFVTTVISNQIPMVVPNISVALNLNRLEPRFPVTKCVVIPHGCATRLPWLEHSTRPSTERLVIVVLGQISQAKGFDLLCTALPAITKIAEVYLIGPQELGAHFKSMPHVVVVDTYQPDELVGHMTAIQPDIGLLLSIVPETFSYTLSELFDMGIPPVATRVGSFAERIRHAENGYLFDPNADALLQLLTSLNDHRDRLTQISHTLRNTIFRSATEMVADYHNALSINDVQNPIISIAHDHHAISTHLELTVADMWKEMKSLHLNLSTHHDIVRKLEKQAIVLEHIHDDQLRTINDQLRTIDEMQQQTLNQAEQLQSIHQECLAKEKNINILQQEALSQTEQLQIMNRSLQAKEALISEREQLLLIRDGTVGERDAQLNSVLSSTSWQITAPLRWFVTKARNAGRVARGLYRLLSKPGSTVSVPNKLLGIWRHSGWIGIKRALSRIETKPDCPDIWKDYQKHFQTAILPGLKLREQSMTEHPLISVIVPTYNTPISILQEMLKSVTMQIYPNWQLCLVDDGSTDSELLCLLEQVAQSDTRIHVHFCKENGGVSKASNYALNMARGSHVVLLDHDDCLEPQALLRVAEVILAHDPDMFYSDEALFAEDMKSLKTLALRPGFSPEYLRGHPYFVHLVGFRLALLKKIGGFDENLRISQDYDLFLRVTEQAQRIVHIAEILYRWRIHNQSAGHQLMDQVMATSQGILQRHLDRSGVLGTVTAGPSFNFFDPHYTLADNYRVAIIIPTKNHGQLVCQCIESIIRTVPKRIFEIVLVDHDSNDPVSLAYFASLPESSAAVRVLHYHGAFNFSAINNWAVHELQGQYSHYLFCNNDIEAIEEGWLERMLGLTEQSDVGIVGAKLFYPDRATVQHAGICIGAFGKAEHYGKWVVIPKNSPELGYNGQLAVSREVSAVTAACLLIKTETFHALGGFDQALAVGFGDVDLCLRARQAGWRVIYCATAHLVHYESITRGINNLHPEDTAFFLTRWQDILKNSDPYYNPSLSLTSTCWEFKTPLIAQLNTTYRIYQKPFVDFICNICGHHNRAVRLVVVENREHPSCTICRSSLRLRAIIYALAMELFGKPLILPDFPNDKNIYGLGMSDWIGYANVLSEKFSYTNTQYHTAPRMDITNIEESEVGRYQFVLSGDIFEHIPYFQLETAFRNSRRLLQAHGIFVFTAPFTKVGASQEHFPNLYDFTIHDQDGEPCLYNRTMDGTEEIFRQLVFHGGDGSTLEMRIFSEPDLVTYFKNAGFSSIYIYTEQIPEFGILWPMNWAVPIVARA